MLAQALQIIMFYLLSAWTGVASSSLAVVRSFTLFMFARRDKVAPVQAIALFILLQIGVIVISWQGLVSLLMIFVIATIYGQWQKNIKITRICSIIASTGFLTYCLLSEAYTNVINEIVIICSAGIALWRFMNRAGT